MSQYKNLELEKLAAMTSLVMQGMDFDESSDLVKVASIGGVINRASRVAKVTTEKFGRSVGEKSLDFQRNINTIKNAKSLSAGLNGNISPAQLRMHGLKGLNRSAVDTVTGAVGTLGVAAKEALARSAKKASVPGGRTSLMAKSAEWEDVKDTAVIGAAGVASGVAGNSILSRIYKNKPIPSLAAGAVTGGLGLLADFGAVKLNKGMNSPKD